MGRSKSLDPLANGEYLAKCRERTAISAAMNGHSQVWPEARLVVSDNHAMFYRDGVQVWSCNVHYAACHFDVSPINVMKGK